MSTASERLAARGRARDLAAALAEAAASHECRGDPRQWCDACRLVDAIEWRRTHGGRVERGRSRTEFSPFRVLDDLRGRFRWP